MWDVKERDDGMNVHKFICDKDGCLRRAFEVIPKDSDRFYNLKGWSGHGPKDAEHVSELDHYCKEHSKI